jgi:ribosomal protein L37AE/L43A
MKHNCDECGKSIREVGRLQAISIKGKHYMWLCNNCKKEFKDRQSIKRFASKNIL